MQQQTSSNTIVTECNMPTYYLFFVKMNVTEYRQNFDDLIVCWPCFWIFCEEGRGGSDWKDIELFWILEIFQIHLGYGFELMIRGGA